MSITRTHCKLFFAAAIVAAGYFAPSVVAFVRRAVYAPSATTLKRSPFDGRSAWLAMAAVPAQADHPRGADNRSAPAQLPPGLILPDISGVWGNTTTLRPGTTATYRIQLTQTGNTITGHSRRELTNPNGPTYVLYSITGVVLASGKAFSFQEGQLLESYPPMQSWCAMRSMTLVPTADGMLVGSLDAPPCGPGTIVLHHLK